MCEAVTESIVIRTHVHVIDRATHTCSSVGQKSDVEHVVVSENLATALADVDLACRTENGHGTRVNLTIKRVALTSPPPHVGGPSVPDVGVVRPNYDLGPTQTAIRRREELRDARHNPREVIIAMGRGQRVQQVSFFDLEQKPSYRKFQLMTSSVIMVR